MPCPFGITKRKNRNPVAVRLFVFTILFVKKCIAIIRCMQF